MKITYSILMALILTLSLIAETNNLTNAVTQSEKDIQIAVTELNQLKTSIQKEKTPLVLKLKEERESLSKLRKQAETARLASGTGFDRQQALRDDVERLSRQMQFVESELQEYRRSILTIAPIFEQEAIIELLTKIDEKQSGDLLPDIAGEAKILFDVSYSWCNYVTGGYLKRGVCLDVDGYEQNGTFAILGSLAWFVSNDGDAGLVVQRINSIKPSYVSSFSVAEKSQIKQLCSDGAGHVPVDLTKGDAIKIHDSKKSIFDDFKAGGYTIYPLIAIGVISVLTAFVKWLYLLLLKPFNEKLALKLADAVRNNQETNYLLMQIQKPFRSIFKEAIDNADIPKEHLEEILYEQIVMATPSIRKYIGMLAVFGAVAPLLGLLGTVTGMIHTFEVITIFGTGNPAILSAGISEALITTKIGLAIAIPTLLVHAYLSSKAKSIVTSLEDQAICFVNALKR